MASLEAIIQAELKAELEARMRDLRRRAKCLKTKAESF
jgi:hypothetical protein